MAFSSFQYLAFFPTVIFICFILPSPLRNIWLLVSSCFFYYAADPRYLPVLAAITILSYTSGLIHTLLNREGTDKDRVKTGSKILLGITIICELGILVYFKYTGFLLDNLQAFMSFFSKNVSFNYNSILLPLGISFILFQAISYNIDVYRGDLPAEKNPLCFALYLAFFPKLISGPIEKAGKILAQIHEPIRFSIENLKEGLSLIILGLFYKLVFADRIAAVINPIFDSYIDYSGVEIALAVILFAFQIYGDFAGYSYMAIGSAKVFGFVLSDNFAAPYLSESISEFWNRWHITLNTWLRDYLYIPLGGNRKGTLRKYCNLMVVFLISGLWHGAAWNFIIWGGLNGLYMIGEAFIRSHRLPFLKNNRNAFSTHLFKKTITFLLIDFAWLFFCMPDIASALGMIRHAVTAPGIREILSFDFVFLQIFPDITTFAVMAISLILIFCIDYMSYYKSCSFQTFFFRQSSAFRWIFGILLLYFIIFQGAYGDTYEQTQFIYFQF